MPAARRSTILSSGRYAYAAATPSRTLFWYARFLKILIPLPWALYLLVANRGATTTMSLVGVILAVLVTFAVSDLIRAESGLLAVTLVGIGLANQRKVSVEGIVEFKEELRDLFLAILFIVLSARLGLEELASVATPGTLVFVLVLMLIVRRRRC